jgi:hypothetical protein
VEENFFAIFEFQELSSQNSPYRDIYTQITAPGWVVERAAVSPRQPVSGRTASRQSGLGRPLTGIQAMKKIIASSVLAFSAIAMLSSAPAAQAASKPKLTCLQYEEISMEPGPSKRGECIMYKNRYVKNN